MTVALVAAGPTGSGGAQRGCYQSKQRIARCCPDTVPAVSGAWADHGGTYGGDRPVVGVGFSRNIIHVD